MLIATRLCELLTYNPRTGVFRWKVARSGRRSEGDIAGAVESRSIHPELMDGFTGRVA